MSEARPKSQSPTPEPPEAKQRKPQSEEEFQKQKTQYWTDGPAVTERGWQLPPDPDTFTWDLSLKPNRNRLIQALEYTYFNRDYELCLRLVTRGQQLFAEVKDDKSTRKQRQEVDDVGAKCRSKLGIN
ncbi:hypothetical protein DIURU_005574 [Diutina rugosa]|uniref:Uncharacterized protein n=1 Tax=Diutina rugosa TaxID=5481 RepID=A0A642UCS6_DIURU|nr:uncharacterized protein DIURU_005574 [Diutina rugosa]KAA8896834.1 hypothetical protein DIURU_005574 [Diutina rugosa]